MFKLSIALICFLVANIALATTFGRGSEVPMTYVLIELCERRFPEYKKQNDLAFSEWRVRNQAAVERAEKGKHFRNGVDTVKGSLEESVTPENLKKVCSELASNLRKPESDVRETSD